MTKTIGFDMKCPRDTNHDGDCGRASCPYCSAAAPQFWYAWLVGAAGVGLIGRMASDVWDEKTINQHIEDMNLGLFQASALRRVIGLSLNEMLDAEGYTPAMYLDQMHTCIGWSHAKWIEHLRSLAGDLDPHAENRVFGKANRR